jgi:hypothetical protein
MKLKGELDAAVWFDMLSILEIKTDVLLSKDKERGAKSNEALDSMMANLIVQLSFEKFAEIVSSDEYEALYEANLKVFKAVDLAEDITKVNEISAYEVAQLNLLRYECKKKLQEKFFDSEVSELKTGTYSAV